MNDAECAQLQADIEAGAVVLLRWESGAAPARRGRYLTPDHQVLTWDYSDDGSGAEWLLRWLADDNEFGTVHYRDRAPRRWAFLAPIPHCPVCLMTTADNEPHSRCMP